MAIAMIASATYVCTKMIHTYIKLLVYKDDTYI